MIPTLQMLPKNILVISVVVIIFIIFVITDITQRLFFIIFILIIGYIYYQKDIKNKRKNKDKNKLISTIEKELNDDEEFSSNIFHVHKSPRSLKFIKQHNDVQDVLYEIRFLQIYDKALYDKIVSLLEYFLKIHFKVMIEKYEFDLYYPILRDLRSEILNSMKTIYFNIPNISTILYIKDLNTYVEERIRRIQAITYKHIKILCHKYNKPYKPPHDFDISIDNHYALF